jgi:alanine racemase
MERRDFLTAAAMGSLAGLAPGAVRADGRPLERPASPGPQPGADLGPDPWIEMDRAALRHNLQVIGQRVGGRPVMAVIKGNGYGHGVVEMGRMLQAEGVEQVAVAKVREALALRGDGYRGTILNLGPFADRDIPALVENRISQTVFTDQVEALSREAAARGGRTPVQVNIDTGLGRVGVPWREAGAFLERVASLPGVRLQGVFSALTEEEDFDRVQMERFTSICDEAGAEGIRVGTRHLASSDAIMNFPGSFLDAVRPGISIYGHYPSESAWQERPISLRPVLTLKTRVVFVKSLRTGESISYHRAFVAERPTRVATLPVGYSDGYRATLAGRTEVLIGGRRFPVVALITANHTIVDVGEAGDIGVGDEVVLIGTQGGESLDAQVVAGQAGISVYKLLIGLNPELVRVIV